ncbi:hypothetical protein KEC55_19090 [Burkholderia cepacia]|uniref:hypothetical protein n=1 Tax=Burkholderia cepacia TaxID=292 RepID=UPI00249D9798|nr:hypothetical protein [Burkholderia cepacia]WGY71923.1 hypothetical protein KEC55_19090 [Burkholderia cepacia]
MIIGAGVLIGVLCACISGVIQYSDAWNESKTCSAGQMDWDRATSVIAGLKGRTVQQMSDDELRSAYHAYSVTKVARPVCASVKFLPISGVAALVGISVFIALFIWLHLIWLAFRAYNKLMSKLK